MDGGNGSGGAGRGPERRTAPRSPAWIARIRDATRRAAERLLGAHVLWSGLFVVVVVTILASQRCGRGYPRLTPGEPAPFDVRAIEDVEVPDEVATQQRKAEARAMVPDLYVHDTQKAAALEASFTHELAARTEIPDAERQLIVGWLREVLQGLVIANKPLLLRESAVTVLHMPQQREEVLRDFESVSDLEAARNDVRRHIGSLGSLPPSTRAEVADLAASFLDANLAEDAAATAGRRAQAERGALPVQIRVPKGTILVRRGEKVAPDVQARIEAIEGRSVPRTGPVRFVALVVLSGLLAFFLYRYCTYHQRHFKRVRHLHAMLVFVLVTMVLIAQAIVWTAEQLAPRFKPPFNDPSASVYLVPFGAGAILVALLANGRIAMVYATFAAILYGALNAWDLPVALWALLVQWAGIYAITSYRERAALLRAGLVVGVVGAGVALAVEAIGRVQEPLANGLYGAALAFVGGAVGLSLLVSFALPLLEGLFRVLTDIRLLELSNVSNPLLSQLAVKAPGSYNHSLIVGSLAEEAATAIGANALFCRVAAFYHDIGKIRKPEYYIENQRGVNPHERLQPSMSALIVSAHVKDGIRMAREARLPEQIIDIIPQHHGTRLMTYFYEKARKQAALSGTEVNDDDFRYPGPKPQTKEAAIFMLADGVEAAARTIEDPTPSRMREMIHQIASRIVLDAQLDACDLTFADLEKIEEAFQRTLVSMYHHRVDYPGYDFAKPKVEKPAGEVRPFRTNA
jgi:putative nucleotidyltransferase with HDIG domain